jgi:hypothetical protein
MFTFLQFRLKHGVYLKNEHGTKKFAEMSMGQLIRKATKKSAFYREMNENMLVEKANLRMHRDELYERPTLDAGGFFSVRRELWANTFLIAVIVVAAIFLNVISVEYFIDEAATLSNMLRWTAAVLVAIVLTAGGMIISERLIAAMMPRSVAKDNQTKHNRRVMLILWGTLLFGIELLILGVAEVQATVLTTDGGSTLLYFGFIVTSGMLPIIAGAFRWHSMRYIDRYKTTRMLRQIEGRLAQIESILRQNEEYESNFYKIKSIEYWDMVNDFKTLKDNLNQKAGIVEPLSGHFAQSYDLFQTEANKRYTQDIRDTTSQSMRKLSLVEGQQSSVGNKLGQAKMPATDAKPKSAPRPVPTGDSSGSEEAEYLSLQPIR